MKKFLLTLTVISILFSSSATQCVSDEQKLMMGVLGGVVVLGGIAAYAWPQSPNPSTSSPEPHSGPQSHQPQQPQQNKQPQDEDKPKLIKDSEKPKENKILSGMEQKNPTQEKTQDSSFLTDIWERLGEEEAAQYFDIISN